MGVAMDAFGWSAEQFLHATPSEFFAMIEARRAANKQ